MGERGDPNVPLILYKNQFWTEWNRIINLLPLQSNDEGAIERAKTRHFCFNEIGGRGTGGPNVPFILSEIVAEKQSPISVFKTGGELLPFCGFTIAGKDKRDSIQEMNIYCLGSKK